MTDNREDRPASMNRRRALLGLGVAGGTVVSGLALGLAPRRAGAAELSASQSDETAAERQPFLGVHQSGITTTRQAAGMVASFDILAENREDLERLLRTLTARIAFLSQGGPAPEADEAFPPPDSGLLGPVIQPDNLTVTVAVGASLFDERFGLADAKPRHLQTMEEFPNDALDEDRCHGDLLLQICSNTAETNIHALRDVIKSLPDLVLLRWKEDGFAPVRVARGDHPESARNLLGFKDGTANPDPEDNALMDRLVWVRDGEGEPAWAIGGTYQVVRTIRNMVERWDRTPLREQQTIIGREKGTGAPLSMAAEYDIPNFAADPEGKVTPLDAHIRLANPRTHATDANLILRRPYNFSRGITSAGQLDMGLLFVCFQANLTDGFLAVQERLNGEPLEEYIKPVGGGYFFALPGVTAPDSYFGEGLLAT